MRDDEFVPNVRSNKKEKVRHGDPKNLLECKVGEVVLLAVRVCRLVAGVGGGEATDAWVNPYDRKADKEIHELFNVPHAARVPVEVDRGRTFVATASAIRHLLPHPDDAKSKEDAELIRKFNRALLELEAL